MKVYIEKKSINTLAPEWNFEFVPLGVAIFVLIHDGLLPFI